MNIPSTILHPELGVISTRINIRACRFTFHPTEDGFVVTVPPYVTMKNLQETIDKMAPKLLHLKERSERYQKGKSFTPDFTIDNDIFHLELKEETGIPNPYASISGGTMKVLYLKDTDFESPHFQKWLTETTEESLRRVGQEVFPKRLGELARMHGFRFTTVKVHKTHGRWGSCSSQKGICLSLYLVLLPSYLRDYIMLHELCHTKYMDHSDKFWALLDKVCGGRNNQYREEVKTYDTSVFTLVGK